MCLIDFSCGKGLYSKGSIDMSKMTKIEWENIKTRKTEKKYFSRRNISERDSINYISERFTPFSENTAKYFVLMNVGLIMSFPEFR